MPSALRCKNTPSLALNKYFGDIVFVFYRFLNIPPVFFRLQKKQKVKTLWRITLSRQTTECLFYNYRQKYLPDNRPDTRTPRRSNTLSHRLSPRL